MSNRPMPEELKRTDTETNEKASDYYWMLPYYGVRIPSTSSTGEKECEDCGQVKNDVALCQNPLEDVEEDLMWLCGECHDSRNEEV